MPDVKSTNLASHGELQIRQLLDLREKLQEQREPDQGERYEDELSERSRRESEDGIKRAIESARRSSEYMRGLVKIANMKLRASDRAAQAEKDRWNKVPTSKVQQKEVTNLDYCI